MWENLNKIRGCSCKLMNSYFHLKFKKECSKMHYSRLTLKGIKHSLVKTLRNTYVEHALPCLSAFGIKLHLARNVSGSVCPNTAISL